MLLTPQKKEKKINQTAYSVSKESNTKSFSMGFVEDFQKLDQKIQVFNHATSSVWNGILSKYLSIHIKSRWLFSNSTAVKISTRFFEGVKWQSDSQFLSFCGRFRADREIRQEVYLVEGTPQVHAFSSVFASTFLVWSLQRYVPSGWVGFDLNCCNWILSDFRVCFSPLFKYHFDWIYITLNHIRI